jgi:hypothetical protein
MELGTRHAWLLRIVAFVERMMQITPTPNDIFSTPASEDDQAQPAPPDDSRNLPELPDPAEGGESG